MESGNFEVPGLNLWGASNDAKKGAVQPPKTGRVSFKRSDTEKDINSQDQQSTDIFKKGVLGVKYKLGDESEISKEDGSETVSDISKREGAGPKSEAETNRKGNKKKAFSKSRSTKVTLTKVKVDQVKRAPSVKKEIVNLLDSETEMWSLQTRMSNWMSSNMNRNIKLFRTVNDHFLTYDQFCTAMVDLDSPFRSVELYALVIQLSTREPGWISIEDIEHSTEPEEMVTVCDLCGFGKERSNTLLNKVLSPEDNQPVAGSSPANENKPAQPKPAQQFSEFLMTKNKSKVGDEVAEDKEDLKITMRLKNMLVKWNKKAGAHEAQEAQGQTETTPPSPEKNRGAKIVRGNTKLKILKNDSDIRGERSELTGSSTISQRGAAEKPELFRRSTSYKKKERLKHIFAKAIANITTDAGKRMRKIHDMTVPSECQDTEEVLKDDVERKSISRLPQPLARYVRVKLRSLNNDNIASCPSHFTLLLTSETLLSYVVHIIGVVNDIHFTEVYISPNRLRHRLMQHSHDQTLAECGYRGYCKLHPQNIILYYDFDIPEPPLFIKSTDMSSAHICDE